MIFWSNNEQLKNIVSIETPCIYNKFTQALSKKEKGGGLGSPGGDDSDGEADYTLTPRTEAKYNKIDEEFHLMMQKSQLNGARVSFPPQKLEIGIKKTKKIGLNIQSFFSKRDI